MRDDDIQKLSSDAFMWADYAFDYLFTQEHKHKMEMPDPVPECRAPEEDGFIEVLMLDYIFPNLAPEDRTTLANLQRKRLFINWRDPDPALEQDFCALRDKYRENIKSQLTDIQCRYVEQCFLSFGDGD